VLSLLPLEFHCPPHSLEWKVWVLYESGMCPGKRTRELILHHKRVSFPLLNVYLEKEWEHLRTERGDCVWFSLLG
jgi:hypothetical protein